MTDKWTKASGGAYDRGTMDRDEKLVLAWLGAFADPIGGGTYEATEYRFWKVTDSGGKSIYLDINTGIIRPTKERANGRA